MNILKVCGVALIAAFSIGVLKIYKSEFVLPVGVVAFESDLPDQVPHRRCFKLKDVIVVPDPAERVAPVVA